jgi:hypothetical protein
VEFPGLLPEILKHLDFGALSLLNPFPPQLSVSRVSFANTDMVLRKFKSGFVNDRPDPGDFLEIESTRHHFIQINPSACSQFLEP